MTLSVTNKKGDNHGLAQTDVEKRLKASFLSYRKTCEDEELSKSADAWRNSALTMACFHPKWAWLITRPDGSKSLYFSAPNDPKDWAQIRMPCRKCVGCRVDQQREWAVRCMHEAQLHEDNTFVTLTYDEEHLPADGSLNHRHWQLFMKRLKKNVGGKSIRFYMCGEYGPETNRPHYHAILFGHSFSDRKYWKDNHQGEPLFTSEQLSKAWQLGFCSLGAVTPQSASYVAGYVRKKITGLKAEAHYQGRKPDYSKQSNRPGIGAEWLKKHADDVYPDDFVLLNGKKMRVPRYYDTLLSRQEPEIMDSIKEQRKTDNEGRYDLPDEQPDRLEVRETCKKAQLSLYKQEL